MDRVNVSCTLDMVDVGVCICVGGWHESTLAIDFNFSERIWFTEETTEVNRNIISFNYYNYNLHQSLFLWLFLLSVLDIWQTHKNVFQICTCIWIYTFHLSVSKLALRPMLLVKLHHSLICYMASGLLVYTVCSTSFTNSLIQVSKFITKIQSMLLNTCGWTEGKLKNPKIKYAQKIMFTWTFITSNFHVLDLNSC